MTIYEPKEMTVDVFEEDSACKRGAVPCRIGRDIRFETEALESFSTHRWDPVIYDAFLVAAAVEFCDRTLVRSSMNWGRKFILHVPVHDVHKWTDKAAHGALTEALNLLTGDDWQIVFRTRKVPVPPPAQDTMKFPMNAEAVMAYSDGMDSQAVAALEGKKLNGRVVRVRIGTSERDISRQERKEMPFHAVPYKVKIAKKDGESSARSRGFKFSLISAMAGYLIDVPVAIIPESGQGALAPVLLPVGHGYEDYRNHPAFTARMERFVYALLGYRFKYKFPRLWMTKGETLREFVENCEGGSKWNKTRSCWQTSRQIGFNGTRRQCGICAACILRRLSVHAAGLKEATDVYVWESLSTKTWEAGASKDFDLFTNALRQYSVAGVLHFEHLAGLQSRSDYQLTRRLSNFELAESLGESPVSVSQKLDRLLRQHAKEWSAFTKDLGPRSFVRQWIRSSAS